MGKSRQKSNRNNINSYPETLDEHIYSWVNYPGDNISEKLTSGELEYVLNNMTNDHEVLWRVERKKDTFERETSDIVDDQFNRETGEFIPSHYLTMPPLKPGDVFKFTKGRRPSDILPTTPLKSFSSEWDGVRSVANNYIWPGEENEWVIYRVTGNPPNFDIYSKGHSYSNGSGKEYETWVETENSEFVVDKVNEPININEGHDMLESYVTIVDVHMV